MRSPCTAIIHLREPVVASTSSLFSPLLQAIRGVNAVSFEPAESLLTVLFDSEQARLAEIVRVIEDCGTAVAGVAQRQGTSPIRM